MRVYFDAGFAAKGKGLSGRMQRVDWSFEFAGSPRYIPAFYFFGQGVVFDVLTVLDAAKMNAFIERYEERETGLSSVEKQQALAEHPYQEVSFGELWLNEVRVESFSSHSSMFVPGKTEEAELLAVQKAYAVLPPGVPFACERFTVPYPAARSLGERIRRRLRLEKIDSFAFRTLAAYRYLPLDADCSVAAGEEEARLSFTHPLGGYRQEIVLSDFQVLDLPLFEPAPLYALQARYREEPAFGAGEVLQFDSSLAYTPRRKTPDALLPEPQNAAAIGIIGGADGPTALFVAGRGGEAKEGGGAPGRFCISAPTVDPSGPWHFRLSSLGVLVQGSISRTFRRRD